MFKESKNRMNVLSEKHLQTLKKQTEDANVASHQAQTGTRHRQSPGTDSHRSQTAIGHRQPLTRT